MFVWFSLLWLLLCVCVFWSCLLCVLFDLIFEHFLYASVWFIWTIATNDESLQYFLLAFFARCPFLWCVCSRGYMIHFCLLLIYFVLLELVVFSSSVLFYLPGFVRKTYSQRESHNKLRSSRRHPFEAEAAESLFGLLERRSEQLSCSKQMFWIYGHCNGSLHSFMCISLQCTLCDRGRKKDRSIPVQLRAITHCFSSFFFLFVLFICCCYFCWVFLSFPLSFFVVVFMICVICVPTMH